MLLLKVKYLGERQHCLVVPTSDSHFYERVTFPTFIVEGTPSTLEVRVDDVGKFRKTKAESEEVIT